MAQVAAGGPTGPGALLELIRSGRATTRAQIMAHTGLSRSTVAQRLDALTRARYVVESAGGDSTRGRPAGSFEVDAAAGVLLVADIGGSHVRTAVTDLVARPLARRTVNLDVATGPRRVLGTVRRHFGALLAECGRDRDAVRGVALGVPGPVEFGSGTVVSPPIMTGWDDYRVPEFFAGEFAGPLLVDNDANLMALGEHRACHPGEQDLLLVKAATGVGAGLMLGGRIHRGALGAAGDIGHIPAIESGRTGDPPLCRCGNSGCVEAYASGWALVRDLRELGREAASVRDVVRLARARDPEVRRLVRRSGRIIGHAVADVASLINPHVIAVAGPLVDADESFLATVREVVYRQSSPLVTRDLSIVRTGLGEEAAIVGAAHLLGDAVFAPAAVDRALGWT
ncbi:ROK family protein [Actinoallomurus sp. CA-142502]|uniref:ROK family protein n=1 Tax=Actinoallomurus sp. CA-142502 TaxID=3239885 RepID=UPI003D922884